jgi:N,N'-diacetyllegionaminate synthase
MKIGPVDLRQRVFVVAEIGNNHEGSFSLAEELIDRAAAAGVDAVKFQTFIPEHYVSRDQDDRLGRLRKFAFSFEQFSRLARLANQQGLQFFSTPFDLASAEALAAFCPAIKISSGDNNFFPLIERVASFRKPIILSTGLASFADVDRAIDCLTKIWSDLEHPGELALLHCVSSYPTPPPSANLAAIRALSMRFREHVIGYSDHTLGTDAAILSVGLGARIIEKHFTLRKDFSDFRDHQLSADPAEMANLVRGVRLAEELIGDEAGETAEIEEPNRLAMRRSIAAGRTMGAGHVLSDSDLTWVRPGGGFAPGDEALVVGRTLIRDVLLGRILKHDDFR